MSTLLKLLEFLRTYWYLFVGIIGWVSGIYAFIQKHSRLTKIENSLEALNKKFEVHEEESEKQSKTISFLSGEIDGIKSLLKYGSSNSADK